MSLEFDLDLDAEPGRVDEVGPGIRRVLAPNPGPFTFKGTGTYIVGRGRVAVIDPGPADAAHIDALVRALGREVVTHLVVTHTHGDHSPGARLLQERVGGIIVGCAPHPDGDEVSPVADVAPAAGAGAPAESDADADGPKEESKEEPKEVHDRDHRPELQLHDLEAVSGPGWTLEAIETPGHIANHLCFAFPEADVIFSGDHVMRWSTSVISPPHGDLRAYLSSLEKVRSRPESVYWPTHGPAVTDPQTYLPALAEHRNQRTRQIISALSSGELTIAGLVAVMYPGLDERLVKAAGRSVLAHLVVLIDDGRVVAGGPLEEPSSPFTLR